MCFIDAVLGLFSTSMFPMLRAMMSRQCTPDEQGARLLLHNTDMKCITVRV
jgi:hypothetical protein